MNPSPSPDPRYSASRADHWDQAARKMRSWRGWGGFYHKKLAEYYRFYIPPGLRILELGSGRGDLLASLEPAFGVGIDLSGEMTKLAHEHHPNLHFIHADAHLPPLQAEFDVIILSDLINDLWDVQVVLERLQPLLKAGGRLVLNTFSYLWEFPLKVAAWLGLSNPLLEQNWFTNEDVRSLLHLTGFQVVRHNRLLLLPLPIPCLAPLLNRYLIHLFPLNHLALTNLIIARQDKPRSLASALRVSVVVPARNEAGNITSIFSRTPTMGAGTELIFVEGNSTDKTYETIAEAISNSPGQAARLIKQTGKGKGDAVRLGFHEAQGDILMILDADLTVPPEDLPRFYQALVSGKGEFINGVRLVYPMEDEAMRTFNKLGNKFFSLAFSWLLNQSIKDTLCGTKALWREDYLKIAANRSYFGEFDPFGDFDLLFGAAKLNLDILEMPVRYRARTYGKTNISRWKHGWVLFKMILFAANKLKFI